MERTNARNLQYDRLKALDGKGLIGSSVFFRCFSLINPLENCHKPGLTGFAGLY